MLGVRLTLVTLSVLSLLACSEEEGTPVRASLDDGQVLLGAVQTDVLLLDGGLGTLEIPLEDVGEMVPVEEATLGDANGYVTVWLRNGSELTGRWADPSLRIGVQAGGERVPVDLPMDDLSRFQLQGDEWWPNGFVYRVRTIHGDDFFVDAVETQVVLENDLGVFAPFLSECTSLAPIGRTDEDWRMELNSGTVLVGPLLGDSVRFALEQGPETVTVPLDVLVSIEREDWYGAQDAVDVVPLQNLGYISNGSGESKAAPRPAMAAEPAEAEGWYSSSGYRRYKK